MLIAVPLNNGKSNYHINQAYVDYIVDSGYTPLCVCDYFDDLSQIVEKADGLLLPGGIDIDPIYYKENNRNSYNVDPDKDAFERNLLYAFTEVGKPVFGICRGFQLIAREFLKTNPDIQFTYGLNYAQHINSHNTNDNVNAARHLATHDVFSFEKILYGNTDDNSFNRMFVNSMHHQGMTMVKNKLIQKGDNKELQIYNVIPEMMMITSYTLFGMATLNKNEEQKVVIEGADFYIGNSTVRGVQWHPEELRDTSLLQKYFNSYQVGNTLHA